MSILEDKGELIQQVKSELQRIELLDDTYKDDPELIKITKQYERLQEEQREQEIQAEKDREEEEPVTDYLHDFMGAISPRASTPPVSTGFPRLDKVLGGGLYEGLYCLGAETSAGKSAFTMQVADQVAQSGHDVIVVALEMSRFQLMARSISRHTYIRARHDNGGRIAWAKTARGILDGSRYERYSKQENALIASAIEDYSKYTNYIHIIEGIGDIGVKRINKIVQKHIEKAKAERRESGERPVLIIDYLQVLAPADVRASDKQNTDAAIVGLKRLSRDNKIAVLAISSLNRNTYRKSADNKRKGEITLDSFKESGMVEYSCDVVLAWQFDCAGSDYDEDVEYKKETREMQIHVLKNRESPRGDRISFRYKPMFNYCEETERNIHEDDTI